MKIENDAKTNIDRLVEKIKTAGLSCTSVEKKAYNFETTVSSGRDSLKLQVYFGKKGVKTVIQGNDSSDLYSRINNLINDQTSLGFKDKSFEEPVEYIGTDESGKGDFFGPLVTAAFYVNSKVKARLFDLGVKDSKELSDFQITKIAAAINSEFPDHSNIIVINPPKYNELYNKFNNLNKLLNWSHSKAIENLIETKNCSYIITDKFSKQELTISSSDKTRHIEFVQLTKAERFLGVAAASILARNAFNFWFVQQNKNGFDLPKGASAEVEKAASRLLVSHGEKKLSELAKTHFKTMGKIRK